MALQIQLDRTVLSYDRVVDHRRFSATAYVYHDTDRMDVYQASAMEEDYRVRDVSSAEKAEILKLIAQGEIAGRPVIDVDLLRACQSPDGKKALMLEDIKRFLQKWHLVPTAGSEERVLRALVEVTA